MTSPAPPTLRALRDEFDDLTAEVWLALLTSLRASVRAGCTQSVDVLTYTSVFWRQQLHSPCSASAERENARLLVILLRERRADLRPVAEAILAEAPQRRRVNERR